MNRRSQLLLNLKCQFFTRLQILNTIHNLIYSHSMPNLIGALAMATIIGNFGAIRLHHLLGPFDLCTMIVLAILGLVFILACLHCFGSVSDQSRKCVDRIVYETCSTCHENIKYWKRRVKILKTFGVHCDPVRILKFSAMYLCTSGIVNILVTLLVMT